MKTGNDFHPPAPQLEAFALGQLDDAEAATVENHITICSECSSRVEHVPADGFARQVRSALARPDQSSRNCVTEAAANARLEPGTGATLPTTPEHGVPRELASHPRYRRIAVARPGRHGCRLSCRAQPHGTKSGAQGH